MEDNIYFKSCCTTSINQKNWFNEVKKVYKQANKVYFFIEKSISVEEEILKLKGLEETIPNIIYNSSKKYFSKKNLNKNQTIYCIKLNKENNKEVQDFINYIYDSKKEISLIFTRDDNGLIEVDFKHSEIISNKLSNNVNYCLITILFIIIITIFAKIFCVMVFPNNRYSIIGIIDGEYSIKYDNVIYNTMPNEEIKELTHGDEMIKFAKKVSPNIKIYYYDASNEKNKIDTENLLNALKYMKDNGVKKISLSLSSKKYSPEIEQWIQENLDIKIYASYNNLINSKDYPAMYKNVYGCGKRVNIDYKDIDYTYRSNTLMILPNIFKMYKGNSYLTLYNAIIR